MLDTATNIVVVGDLIDFHPGKENIVDSNVILEMQWHVRTCQYAIHCCCWRGSAEFTAHCCEVWGLYPESMKITYFIYVLCNIARTLIKTIKLTLIIAPIALLLLLLRWMSHSWPCSLLVVTGTPLICRSVGTICTL